MSGPPVVALLAWRRVPAAFGSRQSSSLLCVVEQYIGNVVPSCRHSLAAGLADGMRDRAGLWTWPVCRREALWLGERNDISLDLLRVDRLRRPNQPAGV